MSVGQVWQDLCVAKDLCSAGMGSTERSEKEHLHHKHDSTVYSFGTEMPSLANTYACN